MKTLSDLFVHTLRDVYFAENALVKALPAVASAAKSKQLKSAIEDHLEETKGQVSKLKKVFASIKEPAEAQKCDAIEGLLKETNGLIEEAGSGAALDAGLIGCAQAVEHYEIARYGSLREWAKVLGHEEAHTLLSEILDQEKAANNKLTNLAVSSVNQPA